MELFILLVVLIPLFAASVLILIHLWVDTRNSIGYVPMPQAAVRAVIVALNLNQHAVLIDLGAGNGRVLKAAERACAGIRTIGYENNPLLLAPRGVEWHRGDLFEADLSTATHVVAYLNAELNARLAAKLRREAPLTLRLVTVRFELPGFSPVDTQVIKGSPAYADRLFIYDIALNRTGEAS